VAHIADANLARDPAHPASRILSAIGRAWRRLSEHRYRPERHYMRGPGPKWHARNSPPQAHLHWPGDRLP